MMMNVMSYKGFLARVEYDPRDNILAGHVPGLAERIGFHGETVAELTADFHRAIDHYLEDCERSDGTAGKSASAS